MSQDSAVGPEGIALSQLIPDSVRQSLLANLTREQRHQLETAFDPHAPNNIWILLDEVRSQALRACAMPLVLVLCWFSVVSRILSLVTSGQCYVGLIVRQ